MTHIRNSFIVVVIVIILCCQQSNSDYQGYNYENVSIYWNTWEDDMPYKFSSIIEDSNSKRNYVAAWEYSYIGDIKSMHSAWDQQSLKINNKYKENLVDTLLSFNRKNAFGYILNQAKLHQIIIINEAHHMPQHRVFTTILLDSLKKIGYSSLGLESYFTPSQTDSLMLSLEYPTFYSGYHIKEPQFGNLIRKAKELGLKIFGYESRGHKTSQEREIIQAENIKNYLDRFPNEKILIYCGFDHVYEGNLGGSWGKAMAERLANISGLNPLTIDQVVFSERSMERLEHPLYRKQNVPEPSVYIDDSGKAFNLSKNSASVDISVFHPRSANFDRPIWMYYNERKEIKFNFKNAKIECPCLVLAYKENEPIGLAIPYDIQETNTKNVKLVLDSSDYNIIIWNQDNIQLKTFLKVI